MPDNMNILFLIVVAGFGGIVGYMIGVLIMESKRRKSLQIVWYKIDKIIEKVLKMEKDSSEQSNLVSNLYNPQKVTLKAVIDKIIDIADRLEKLSNPKKKNPQQTSKSKLAVANTEKVETHTRHLAEKDFIQTKSFSENLEIISPPEISSVNSQTEPTEYTYQSESLSSQIMTLYNRGINDRSDRNLFWETFSIVRIGNANAVAQRIGEASAPDFREAGNGDFLAVENDNQNYFVVPLFDTTITTSAFNEGGIGYAFECYNYDSQSARSIFKVNQAATFRREGEQWFLVGKGELVLQN